MPRVTGAKAELTVGRRQPYDRCQGQPHSQHIRLGMCLAGGPVKLEGFVGEVAFDPGS